MPSPLTKAEDEARRSADTQLRMDHVTQMLEEKRKAKFFGKITLIIEDGFTVRYTVEESHKVPRLPTSIGSL